MTSRTELQGLAAVVGALLACGSSEAKLQIEKPRIIEMRGSASES